MKNSRVFVVNEPLRREENGFRTRFMDISSAAEYGKMVFMLPAGSLPTDPSPSIATLSEYLADFTASDYLLPVGDIRAITWAAALAARSSGGTLRILEWKSSLSKYLPVEVQLWTEDRSENDALTFASDTRD